jgi:hypothetical protein
VPRLSSSDSCRLLFLIILCHLCLTTINTNVNVVNTVVISTRWLSRKAFSRTGRRRKCFKSVRKLSKHAGGGDGRLTRSVAFLLAFLFRKTISGVCACHFLSSQPGVFLSSFLSLTCSALFSSCSCSWFLILGSWSRASAPRPPNFLFRAQGARRLYECRAA